MSSTKNNQSNSIPQWQSERMKNLISERWQEIWEVVEAREKEKD
ncbi:MAG: hypothetical protein AAGE96_07040 [Cyanobacteria bacterium P01_G01_bin.19]